MSWRSDMIERLQKEETEEYNREHGYLKNLDKCSYYDLVDRGIDPDEQIGSMWR